jgi:hypothetical protein
VTLAWENRSFFVVRDVRPMNSESVDLLYLHAPAACAGNTHRLQGCTG